MGSQYYPAHVPIVDTTISAVGAGCAAPPFDRGTRLPPINGLRSASSSRYSSSGCSAQLHTRGQKHCVNVCPVCVGRVRRVNDEGHVQVAVAGVRRGHIYGDEGEDDSQRQRAGKRHNSDARMDIQSTHAPAQTW
jgi:hypothetical protein